MSKTLSKKDLKDQIYRLEKRNVDLVDAVKNQGKFITDVLDSLKIKFGRIWEIQVRGQHYVNVAITDGTENTRSVYALTIPSQDYNIPLQWKINGFSIHDIDRGFLTREGYILNLLNNENPNDKKKINLIKKNLLIFKFKNIGVL